MIAVRRQNSYKLSVSPFFFPDADTVILRRSITAGGSADRWRGPRRDGWRCFLFPFPFSPFFPFPIKGLAKPGECFMIGAG